jgi:hypothetical protein
LSEHSDFDAIGRLESQQVSAAVQFIIERLSMAN